MASFEAVKWVVELAAETVFVSVVATVLDAVA